MTRRAMSLLMVFLVPTGLWSSLGIDLHGEHHHHGDSLSESAHGHDEFEWRCKGDRHEAHQDLRFEAIQDLYHAEHPAVCPACGSSAAGAHRAPTLLSPDVVPDAGPGAEHLAILEIAESAKRSRAPPAA